MTRSSLNGKRLKTKGNPAKCKDMGAEAVEEAGRVRAMKEVLTGKGTTVVIIMPEKTLRTKGPRRWTSQFKPTDGVDAVPMSGLSRIDPAVRTLGTKLNLRPVCCLRKTVR